MKTIVDGVKEELERARKLKEGYDSLPIPSGVIGSSITSDVITRAEAALKNLDAVELVKIYPELQQLE